MTAEQRQEGGVTLSGTGGYAVVGYIYVSTHVRTMVGGSRACACACSYSARACVCARSYTAPVRDSFVCDAR
jgi:hypothetical protein